MRALYTAEQGAAAAAAGSEQEGRTVSACNGRCHIDQALDARFVHCSMSATAAVAEDM